MMTQVCYIGGFGRSGSTLLERMLAAATGACPLGEVVWVWERGVIRDEKCGCGERFSQCDFWRAVGDVAFGGWRNVDAVALEALRASIDKTRSVPALLLSRRKQSHAREYSGYVARIYAAAGHVSGAATVIDSSKHASTAFILRLDPRIQLKAVHVVRDSRGVAYSWTKTMLRPEVLEGGPQELMYQYSPWRSALLWDAQNLAFMLLGSNGVPTRRLKYEQLLRDPVAAISDLARFIDEQSDASRTFVNERTVELTRAHQVAGNPMRFKSGQIVLHEDDAWRESLGGRSCVTVSTLTLPLLARYGYLGSAQKRPRT